MGITDALVKDRVNLLAVVLALGLIVSGAVALTRGQAAATVFLMLGGFTALAVVEYRRVHHTE